MADSLVELLAEHSIRMKRLAPGAQEHVRCPRCEGGRTKELSLSVRVDADGQGATWNCKRGSCGWSDGGKVRREDPRADARARIADTPQRVVSPPRPHTKEQQSNRPQWLWEFFDERNIGAKTVEAFGVYATKRRFPPPIDDENEAIVFPYRHGGEVVNRKYRPYPQKHPMMQEKDALPTLFNADCLRDGVEEVFWVEGEIDAMALHECGYHAVVTLKDGAPAKVGADRAGKRFDALLTHADKLDKVKRFYLAGDSDVPGLALREELAQRLGRHRCWLVNWPYEAKDASEVLGSFGAEEVQKAVQAAKPYPLEGLRRIEPGLLQALRQKPPPPVMHVGLGALDAVAHWPADGRLIVVTGYPNSGKALALDTPIPTPTGWSTMGGLNDGDEVFSADGSVTRIAKAHPVMVGRDCAKVTFSDGAEIICDYDHLWLTDTAASRISKRHAQAKRGTREQTLKRGTDQRHLRVLPSVKTTRAIAESLTVSDGANRRFNHSIPVAAPLQLGAPWPLRVPPYTLGAWLGDGTSASGGFTSADREIVDRIRADGFAVTGCADPISWYIRGLKVLLREDGVLGSKHIPLAALRASISDRTALLQGLMDTDGHVSPAGVAEFCTTTKALADGVAELAATLGIRVVRVSDRAMLRGVDCGERYRVQFRAQADTFALSRKAARVNASQRHVRSRTRTIIAVESVPSVPVRCITVEHPSSLYLCGREMIPTHNTAFVRFLMVRMAQRHDRRWLVFSPEMQPWESFAAECAEVLVGRPFWPRADRAHMTDEELGKAEAWLSDRVHMLEVDGEDEPPSLDWMLERARYASVAFGITDLLVDPYNELENSRGEMTETDFIGRCLQRLKAAARRYGFNVWIIAHPAKPGQMRPGEKLGVPGPYQIAGSAHWANKTDMGITVHQPDGIDGGADIHIWKTRFRRWGRRTDSAKLLFDPVTGRYSSSVDESPDLLEGPWP